MKDWYRQLRLEYKVVVWSLIVICTLMLLAIPCYFFSLMEIPNGVALGGGIAVILYLILGLCDTEEKSKKSLIITVVVLIIRFLIIGGLLFLVGWLYYRIGFKAFNIFAVAGGYFIPLPVHIIVSRKE